MGSTQYQESAGYQEPVDQFEGSWIRPAILGVVTLKIAGIVLVFDPVGLQSFDYPKSLFSRGTEWLLVGLVLLAVLRFGIGVVPRTRLHFVVLLYVLAVAVSGLAGESTYVSLYGEQGSYLGLTFLGDMVVLYLALAIALRRLADWRPLAFTVIAVAVAASLYAIVQYVGADPIPWLTDPSIRPFSTLGNPNQLAHLLTIATGIGVGTVLFAPRRRVRIGAALCCGLFLVTSGLTGARSGLLGIAVVLIAAFWVAWRARGGRASLRATLTGVLAAAVLAGLALASPAGQRLTEGPLADRLLQYTVALAAFGDRPLFGYGPDQYQIGFIRNRPPQAVAILGVERPLWAHDFVLQALVTTGLLGAAALLLLIAQGSAALWTTGMSRAPEVAVPLLLAWVGYWSEALVTVSSASIDWFPWVALGIGAALVGRRDTIAHRRSFGPLARGTLIAAACLGAISGVAAFRANHDAGSARLSLRAGPSTQAIAAAASAVRLDPGRADYWNWLGIASEAMGQVRDASVSYGQAVQRSGYVATYWANLARARAELSADSVDMRVAALDAARRAIEIDPYEPLVRQAVADTAFLLGDCDRALSEILVAYSLSRGDVGYISDLDRAAHCTTNLDTARQLLTSALGVAERAPVYASLAVVELRANDHEAARSSALRALELDPANASAHVVLDAIGP
jgi:O-antigen ligase/tetratricopeptide (TPR) repeat protein